jgi:hypothetical protein
VYHYYSFILGVILKWAIPQEGKVNTICLTYKFVLAAILSGGPNDGLIRYKTCTHGGKKYKLCLTLDLSFTWHSETFSYVQKLSNSRKFWLINFEKVQGVTWGSVVVKALRY